MIKVCFKNGDTEIFDATLDSLKAAMETLNGSENFVCINNKMLNAKEICYVTEILFEDS